ncbi:WD40 repeat-containing protein, putative [Bodo saltans]|uniref:WD40 repeat-containing protein, putative n=1 Tax=Bodo saltans TaxID=75058 RepID=A0A0S4JI35_BODSA|nr:WD40 repeat-containing protein, putative [Bodo saltans]|eukprot:CUG89589.1 WD40 repeat-containing protein, putative [Bodo saltans]
MSQRKLNLVLALADGDMEELHKKFNRLGNNLDRQQFTNALSAHCPSIASIIASGVQGTNIVDHLFFHVDMNGDGLVSWDDLFDYAVGTANERLQRLPAECTRSYTFSRFFPRQDNVLYSTYFPEPDLLMLSSRHIPVQLLRPESMVPLQTFYPDAVGGVGILPVCSTYLGATETLAVAFNDMRLRLWSSMDKEVPTAAHPLRLDHMVTKLRAIPTISTSFLMGSDNGGNLVTFEASRHALGEPRVRSSLHLHSRKVGGISDFCIMKPQESRIVTAGYDRQLLWTDVAVQRSSVVGMSPCVLRHVEYFESHQCVIAVGHDNRISSWVTHQSQKPCTMFEDPSRPHTTQVIGVSCVPNTPQVLTCDASGMVKVWDMRNFRCAQTFHAAEGFNVEAESGLCKPLDDHDMGSIVNSFCYLEGQREACAIVSSGVHMHMYDKGAQPQLAAHTPLNCIRFNPLSQTIMTLASTAVQIWDSDLGHLHAEVPKTCKEDMTTMTLDGVGRRMFIGTQGGEVEVRSCDGANTTLDTHKMHRGEVTAIVYSQAHRALLSLGVDGFLSMVLESENSNTPQRQKLSNRPMLCMTLGTELGLIAAGGKNGSTYVMDIMPPRNEDSELKHNHQASSSSQVAVHCVAFVGSFPLLAVGYENGDVLIWSVRPLKESIVLLAINLSASTSGRGEWKLGTTAHPSSLSVPKMKRCESEAPQVLVPAPPPQGASGLRSSQSLNSGGGSGVNHSPTTTTAASAMQQYHNSVMSDRLLTSVLGRALDDTSVNSASHGSAEPAAIRPTCLAFDRVTHHLFIATNRGHIQVWAMCPFLQALELPTCLYPSSPLLSVETRLAQIQKGKLHQWRPTLVCGVHAHRDEIVDLQVIPTLDIIASCGDDQRVLLFDTYGNRLAELSQGRVPDFEAMAPFSNPAIDVAEPTPSTVTSVQANIDDATPSSTAIAPRQPAQKKTSTSAPGSSRKSRRPTVDRMLRQIYEPQVSDDPRDYKPADGHTIDQFDIDASSPSRNANSTRKGGLLVATGPGSKLRRKSSLLSQAVLDSLVNAAPDQAGQQCQHAGVRMEMSLKLPRRAMVAVGGASVTGGGELLSLSPRAKREPEVSIADASTFAERGEGGGPRRLHNNASPLPIDPADDDLEDSSNLLASGGYQKEVEDDADDDGDEPLLTFATYGSDDVLGNTAPYNASTTSAGAGRASSPWNGPAMVNLVRKRLSAVAQLIVAKSNIKAATLGSPTDPKQHMSIDRRRFSARLHPIFPPVDENSESNEKHLITLLRSVEDTEDWMTDAMKRRIAEYAAGLRTDEEADINDASYHMNKVKTTTHGDNNDNSSPPLGYKNDVHAQQHIADSPLRSRASRQSSSGGYHNKSKYFTPPTTTAIVTSGGRGGGNGVGGKPPHNSSAATSSVDDIQWTTAAAAAGGPATKMSPRKGSLVHHRHHSPDSPRVLENVDDSTSAASPPLVVGPNNNNNAVTTETDDNLPAPSGLLCEDPVDSTAAAGALRNALTGGNHDAAATAAAISVRGGEVNRDLDGTQHKQQRKIHDWLVSTGKHLPQLKLSNETKLVVPTVATPMETLKLLHDAWQLAHSSGGTALHYLGIAGEDGGPGSPTKSSGMFSAPRERQMNGPAMSTIDEQPGSTIVARQQQLLLNRGTIRSAGGMSSGTRCSTSTPIVVGIAKLAEYGDGSSSPPRQRSAGGGQLVLYGPKQGPTTPREGEVGTYDNQPLRSSVAAKQHEVLLPLSPRGRSIGINPRTSATPRTPRVLLPPAQQQLLPRGIEEMDVQTVGLSLTTIWHLAKLHVPRTRRHAPRAARVGSSSPNVCLAEYGDGSSSPPRQRSAGGGQLVLYGPKQGPTTPREGEVGTYDNQPLRSSAAAKQHEVLLPLSPRGRSIGINPRTSATPKSPRVLLPPAQQQLLPRVIEEMDMQTVGIHRAASARVQSGNVYTSHVRHGHVPLGRSTASMQSMSRRGPTRPDAKTARISILEEELKRCLARKPLPEEPSWL